MEHGLIALRRAFRCWVSAFRITGWAWCLSLRFRSRLAGCLPWVASGRLIRQGIQLGLSPVSHSARGDHVRYSHGHHCPHHPLAGRRYSQPGFYAGARREGPNEPSDPAACRAQCSPTALSVMGLQLGYLLGGSILIETVFSWPAPVSCSTARFSPATCPSCKAPFSCWPCSSSSSTLPLTCFKARLTPAFNGADHERHNRRYRHAAGSCHCQVSWLLVQRFAQAKP